MLERKSERARESERVKERERKGNRGEKREMGEINDQEATDAGDILTDAGSADCRYS